MAKSSQQFVCQSCGAVYSKWAGKCEACGEWNTIVEEQPKESAPKGLTGGKGNAVTFTDLSAPSKTAPRRTTGISELDRVLGGGLVDGSAVLIGGDPGIGKSTILLQAVASLAQNGASCVYISGEESVDQIRLRAQRLGLEQSPVELAAATSVRDILTSLDSGKRPDILVIDSVQTMYIDNIESAPGTVSQVRASSHELIRLAKRRGMALLLVGHVTKEGQIAGPRVLEHMVDTVLYFEGERGHQFRILRSVKNRFGGTDEIGVFEMSDAGLQEVANPSSLFLSQHDEQASGCVVFAGMEGSRPMLVEIQALVAPTMMATPRRAVVGWDSNRLAMILAVLEARCGVRFGDREVYLNVAGGLRIAEPAADLAVAAALVSALTNVPVPPQTIFCGEIGLSSEVRAVSRIDARLREAEKLGFERAVLPKASKVKSSGLRTTRMNYLQDLLSLFKGGREREAAV